MDEDPQLSDEIVPHVLDFLVALRAVCGGDLEKNIILLAIAERTIAHPGFRSMSSEERFTDGIFPSKGLNVLSIAESSGIPRETVRRKVAAMVHGGWLAYVGGNVHFTAKGYRELTPARVAQVTLATRLADIVRKLPSTSIS